MIKTNNKENCIWATRKEQTRNRGGGRATRLYTYDGKTMCIKDWAKEVGISNTSMQKAALNKGWPLEKSLFKKRGMTARSATLSKAKQMSLTEWSKYLGIKRPTLVTRLKKNLPLDKVFLAKR